MKNLSRLLEVYSGKLWLIGAAASYEVYFKILNQFPTIEQDLDLEILPITSLKFSVGGSYPRSSLMESFVPLGGFFSIPPETKSPISSNACQNTARCHLCNEKYEQELAALSKGELRASVAEQYQSTLPSWLQPPAQPGPIMQGKDDSLLLTAKITGLQRKWDGICQQHHLSQTFLKGYQFPHLHGSQVAQHSKQENSNNQENKNVSSNSSNVLSKAKNLSILSKSREIPSESPTSVTSVTTDLGLGIKSPSHSSSRFYDVRDPKSVYKALVKRVSRQEEAISAIVDTITKSHRNVWINIRGPDRLGKKKLGLAIAETLYGSKESLIYADLSFQNRMTRAEALFDCHVANKYELTMRGTVVDYLVGKLSKNPSVVFLENIDRADLVVQNSLSKAVRTGRLSDLRGREVNISNCIFLGTINSSEKSRKYAEEDVLQANGGSIQMMIRFDLNDDPSDENLYLINKRKLRRTDQCERVHKKASKSYLDLNLPVSSEESDLGSDNSRSSWVEDFDGLIDRTVDFEPFDFDGLGERVLEEINFCLRNVVGSECWVEIESGVMQQILAGAYLFGETRVEDWVRSVVTGAFSEAMGKFGLNDRSIVKIGRCEGVDSEELLLPDRILIK
ncbi:ATP-dependent clp protease atp-binding subunit clpc1 [Phtheirospermum japonicum]|uniref:ATP-dependent clp protease atp-binding subunit clpc1 n=1 Tax=Phtheirospermum japonicum TaxID=374723 RepID=A0A830BWC4_9LAMI|nr:ATP-dependent clp protease atp-binding subunit clpc1 [Phtheirospermum japonicum]